MDEFVSEVVAYAQALGVTPGTVVQRAGCGNGSTWNRWLASRGPSLRTVDKLLKYMADNPVGLADAQPIACQESDEVD